MSWKFYTAAGQEKTLISSIELVSVLPSSPTNGQEVYFQDTAMAVLGIVWHLRYRAAASGSYKWEFVGGSNLFEDIPGSNTFANGAAFVDCGAQVGPTVTVPLAGDYAYQFGAMVFETGQTAGATLSAGLNVNTAAPVAPDIASAYAIAGAAVTCERAGRLAGLAASTVLKVQYNMPTAAGGSTHTTRYRYLAVCPIRVA